MARPAPFPELPAVAPWYRVIHDSDRVMLEHGGSLITLEGRAAALLIPALLERLDGTRRVAELVVELGPAVEPSVRNALELLHQHGLLCDGSTGASGARDSAVEAAIFVAASTEQRDTVKARASLAAAEVAIAGRGAAAAEIGRLLGEAGVVRLTESALGADCGDDGADLLIAVPRADEVERLDSLNARRLAAGRAWLTVPPHDGRAITIGPLYLPGSSSCHACFGLRRGAGSGFELDFERIESVPTRAASPSFVAAVAAGLAAMLAVRWLAAADPTLPGRFYTLETVSVLELELHHLLRVPRCPVCGPGPAAVPTPWFSEAGVDG